jgi:hypothetical protein
MSRILIVTSTLAHNRQELIGPIQVAVFIETILHYLLLVPGITATRASEIVVAFYPHYTASHSGTQ